MVKSILANKWVKLICGASNEDIASIEDLCAIYSAAGVDYIDVAADPSVVTACLLYTSPSPRDGTSSRMPSSA